MLFGFRLPVTAPIAYHEIFMVDSSDAKLSMRAATFARDQWARLLASMQAAPIGTDCSALIDLIDSYIPMISAVVEQVHKTQNRRMTQRLGSKNFFFRSFLEILLQKRETVLTK